MIQSKSVKYLNDLVVIMKNIFDIDILSIKNYTEVPLTEREVGLKYYDLYVLLTIIEHKYRIQLNENDLSNYGFINLRNISEIVMTKVENNERIY